jgi:single-stranded-DNA-specific exonuclease
MQFPAKRWLLPEEDVSRRTGADSVVDRLMAARGVPSGAARQAFFRPELKHLQRPGAMHGMRDAAAALCEAVRNRRRIAIYGDYDVDGVMATAIVWHLLRALAPDLEVRTYVPHRIEEGYGLNPDALRRLREEGIEVVVTVDCGVSAVHEARLAREIGLELIVTDHHELKATGEVPVARAVVHPRLTGEGVTQRFGELCGAGVAWKLAWQVAETWSGSERLPEVLRERLLTLLPLAAVGTIADVVPLVDENRVLVARGLHGIGRTGIVGMDSLLAASRVESASVDPEKIAFRLAPRINAAGRMGHAELAIELFTTADARRADDIVDTLGALNEERRTQERAIFESALEKLDRLVAEGRCAAKPRGIVLHDEEWNLGIVGIVCSKLVELHACPVVLVTRNKDAYKGSGRSVKGIELHRVLEACSAHLSGYGGHAMAAGMQVGSVAEIEAFRERFTEECDRLLPPEEEQKPPLEVDCACGIADIASPAVVTEIAQFAPFGRDNRKPVFLLRDVKVTQTRVFGKVPAAPKPSVAGKAAPQPMPPHLELVVKSAAGGREVFLRVQWWGGSGHAEEFAKGTCVDLVVEVGMSTFSRMAEVEAKLVDIRHAVSARVEVPA